MDFVEKQHYTTSTLCAVAGCEPVTFRAWRNRNGLFPETRVTDANKRSWNRFSIEDICVARTVSTLTYSGYPANDAVWIAQKVARPALHSLLKGKDFSPLAVICRGKGGKADEIVYAAYADTMNIIKSKFSEDYAVGTFLDFFSIIEEVLAGIKAVEAETVLDRGKAFDIVAQAWARGLSPSTDDEKDDDGTD